MPTGVPIEIDGLSKHFGGVTAVENLSFTVQPGRVTGFLGPNGAGKTTTLRVLLGLVRPSQGTATFGGKRYRELERPLETVGAALEAASFHPGRTARNHLAISAATAGVPRARVAEVLDLVGMTPYADRRVGGFSMGMRQRLGLANTLLGDPGVLVLDEPINGLDPEGIRWIRGFLQRLAGEGRTVLVSSHLLSEVQQSVDRVVIIAKGRLVHEGTLAELETDSLPRVVVDSPDRTALAAALEAEGLVFTTGRQGLIVDAPDPAHIGHLAFVAGIELHALSRQKSALEDSFLNLVGERGVSAEDDGADAAEATDAAATTDEPGTTGPADDDAAEHPSPPDQPDPADGKGAE
ncbi:multidrug ABC transporter ATP-binding protein [Agromyces rhizosphaerae]|uniref:Multidrug ABC transporter ATP-binding protein n=1 Tax=Agromyces rhizosphaerae TaxID=88374 RepID=A0A9W6CXK2_9MICO|nr:ABC transporter ATP-binding protein [Agromyces rhizosphaerae]GLI27082.1 multidrug ABC transporter ATP-binding protein [Agromyces rhizosphaerae]